MQLEKTSINQDGIVGTLFHLKGTQANRGLIIISGSEGGIPEYIAQRFVREDFTVLALGYFGAPGLPDSLEEIPLEYFIKAISFFRCLPQVDPNQIGLIGNSRGAELVLLLASKIKLDVKAICALVPSCYVNGGFPFPNKPAWSFQSRPITPFLGALTSKDPNLTEREDLQIGCQSKILPFHQGSETDPYIISDLFIAREKRKTSITEIPIEKISVPLLLIAAEEDKIWPSKHYVEKMVKKIRPNISHYIHAKAGHGIAFPYLREYDRSIFHPIGKFWCLAGGDPDANQKASDQTEEMILNFLKQYML